MICKKHLHNLYSLLARTRTNALAGILFFGGVLCFLLMPASLPRFGKFRQDVLFSLAFICWGMIGVLYVLRQEVDFGLLILRGPVAILIGVVIILLSLWLASIPYFGENGSGILAQHSLLISRLEFFPVR